MNFLISLRCLKTSTTRAGRLSGIYLAAVVCDSLQLGWPHQDKEIHFSNVDSPLVFAAALLLAHRRLKTDLGLSIETEAYVFFELHRAAKSFVCIKNAEMKAWTVRERRTFG